MPADLPAYLLGTWDVVRDLHDADLGAGRFAGQARFTRAGGDAIAWHEEGRMRIGGYDGPARRELAIVPGHDAGWEVRFADGRPFHRLDLSADACAVEHPCGDDRYTGEFTVRGPDAFDVCWRVSGPRKAQALTGRYVRAPR
jgi:hypothetical protein